MTDDKNQNKEPGQKEDASPRTVARGKANIDAEALRLKKERLIAQKRALLAKKQAAAKATSQNPQAKAAAPKPPLPADATRIKPAEPSEATQFAKPLNLSAKPAVKVPGGDAKTVFKAPPKTSADADQTDISLPISSGSVADANPLKRDVLKNRFILEDVLGAGGMGVVYKAKDLLKVEAQDRDPYVAIKVLGEEFKSHPEAFIALQRESRKTQRIAHPNIVNVHDFDKDGHTVFMTMEFLEGTPLDNLIKKYRATGLPPMDAWQIFEGICSALEYAHAQSIIHSDLKPGNIFVTGQNTAKVFDFGIARAVASAEQSEAAALEDRTVFDAASLGALTPAYASLEMLEGETPDVRDDIYALGCIAYELFTGRHPFDKKNAKDALEGGLKPKRIENVSKRQWKVIEKALSFKREDRIDSVKNFWAALRKVHQKPIAAWAITFLILSLAGAYVYYEYNKPEPEQRPRLSEEKFRNEIEFKLRLEQVQKNLKDLLEEPSFDVRWEGSLWEEVNNLQGLVGPEAQELIQVKTAVVELYVKQVEKEITAVQFALAQGHAGNGQRYTPEEQPFGALLEKIKAGIASAQEEQKAAQAQAKIQKQKQQVQKKAQQSKASQRNAFKLAMTNVNEQLACNRLLDMNDFAIAIDKMKALSLALYKKEESRIIESLAQCITKISRNFPDRAQSAKQMALNIFNNDKRLANVKFETLDACNVAKAGLGARGRRLSCEDTLAAGGKGPELVVVPAGKGFAAFAIGRYEVSNSDMIAFCKASGACAAKGNAAYPATSISLKAAQQYTEWLSEQTGKDYRLPTSKEWVYAATGNRARLDSNRNCFMNSRGIQKGGAAIEANVGQKSPWGLVNVVGNAREWVEPQRGSTLALGGSYNTPMESCSLSLSASVGAQGDAETGFRVLRELDN